MYFSESDNFTFNFKITLSSSTAFSKESKLLLITACPSLLSFYMGQHFTSNMELLVIAFEVGERNP